MNSIWWRVFRILLSKNYGYRNTTAKWKHIWIGNWRRFTRNSLRWTEKRAGQAHGSVPLWCEAVVYFYHQSSSWKINRWSLSLSTDTTFSAQSPWNENCWWELLWTRARAAEEYDLVRDGRSPIYTKLSWTRHGEVEDDGVLSRPGQWVSRVTRIQLLSNEMWRDGNSSYEALALTDLVTHCMTWLVGDKIRTVLACCLICNEDTERIRVNLTSGARSMVGIVVWIQSVVSTQYSCPLNK